MTDHVARMVEGWLSKAAESRPEPRAVSSLVDSIHRMIREAERETLRRCTAAAIRASGQDAAQIALAIGATRPSAQAHEVSADEDPT